MEKIFDKEVESYLMESGVCKLEIAKIKYNKLKYKSIEILENVIDLIKNDDLTKISKYVAYSPAGDGYGCENNYIDFGHIIGNEGLDIIDLVSILEDLRYEINKF